MADDAYDDLPMAGAEEEVDDVMKDELDEEGEEVDYSSSPVAMKVGEEKEIGKQGLRKRLLKEGEGWDRPESGDEVQG
jgi:FK506-binding protein 4/5